MSERDFRPAVWGALACALAAGASLVSCGSTRERDVRVRNGELADQDRFSTTVRPFLTRWCTGCHGGEAPKEDLALDRWSDAAAAVAQPAELREIRLRLEAREMPPAMAPQPPDDEVEAVLAWLNAVLAEQAASVAIDPGRVTVRRLSRVEYDNTIRDLLGVHLPVAHEFPAEDLGHGFDNIGDATTLSPLHLEKYVAAAERIAAEAIVDDDPSQPRRVRVAAGDVAGRSGRIGNRNGWAVFYTNGEIRVDLRVRRDGHYLLRARAYEDHAGGGPAAMAFRVDGKSVASVEVKAVRSDPEVYEHNLDLERGQHTLGVAFVNDFYNPQHPDRSLRDRNLAVEWIEIAGPLEGKPLPASHRRIFTCDPEHADPAVCAHAVLPPLVTRAFRRPASDDEVERLTELVMAAMEEGSSFEGGVRVALTAILSSPNFLFRVERDPTGPGEIRDLDDFEIATRLSYFLWSTMPDDELFELAHRGGLRDQAVVERQVRRMLRDTRASALSQNFAAQWLELRLLDDVAPDPQRFPDFDDDLRASMRRETELFFEAVLREERSVWELLDADFTFLDERLAEHYGVAGVTGPTFRRTRLDDPRRGGLLTQASILTVTSNPTRTSPVKRGKWILEQILDAPPPPPPPGFDSFDESTQAADAASLRERLAQHRSDPNCAVCHARMDTLGFGLENYDAIGAWREKDGKWPVEAAGTLPGGRTFEDPAGLKAILGSDAAFLRCVAKKLATYALGRGLVASDDPAIDRLLAGLPSESPTLTDIILGVVRLDAFRKRRAEAQGD